MRVDLENLTLLPPDGEEFAPDIELADYVDLDDEPITAGAGSERPIGTNASYDVTNDRIGGRVGGVDAVIAVLKVALQTKRGEHPGMYPSDFGMEDPERMLGQVYSTSLAAEHVEDVKDTITSAHDRVSVVSAVDFQYDPDDTYASMIVEIAIDTGETATFQI